MDLVLEEEFLELMMQLLRGLPLHDIWQTGPAPQRARALLSDQDAELHESLTVRPHYITN